MSVHTPHYIVVMNYSFLSHSDPSLSLASGGGDATPQPLDQGDDLLSKLLEGGGGAIDREHQKLESQIRLNEALSGIKFESTDWEVIRKGEQDPQV